MLQADETASGGQAGEGVDRAAQLMHRMDATQPTATFKKVMALTSAGVFVDAMDVYLAGGVKSTLAETGFATNEPTAAFLPVLSATSSGVARRFSSTCCCSASPPSWVRFPRT